MSKSSKFKLNSANSVILVLLVMSVIALVLSGLEEQNVISLPMTFYEIAFVVLSALFLVMFVYNLTQVSDAMQADIASEELRDKLTHLPNYSLFLEHLEHSIHFSKRQEKVLAVVNIDIDKLGELNHQYGYRKTDMLVGEVAERILQLTRESDTVARLGGSEFGIILNMIEHEEEIENALHRICGGLADPFEIDGESIKLGMNSGISTYPEDCSSANELIRCAHKALEKAKSLDDKNYCYFNNELEDDSERRHHQIQDLEKALQNNEFLLMFQPKVDAATGSIKGMESLLRWKHPERGIVSPVEFIPLLEESGLIVEVGDWVLKESCRVNKQWQEMGLEPISVSVNVSGIQFKRDDIIERIQSALNQAGLSPQHLEVELTESCLMTDVTRNIEILHEIKQMGVSIAIDDFGTGYSSLSYLQRFPIDTLKIDRSFITNVQNRKDNDNAAIVTAIMALSHSLRLDVVAEGVETAQELTYLHALGCKTIQGFLFSKPLSFEEFTQIQQDSIQMKSIIEQVREEMFR